MIRRIGLWAGTVLIAGCLFFAWMLYENGGTGPTKPYSQLHNQNKAERTADREAWEESRRDLMDLSDENLPNTMFGMLCQKVKAENKPTPVPMNIKNIKKIVGALQQTTIEHREELLAIAERWTYGDFTNAVNDYNALAISALNPSKATDILSYEEEEVFVLNEFGEKEAVVLTKEQRGNE
ncbi:DUF6241 domain-containing protein [Bacillus sp. 1P06AnD]|uniref:DUF6241 domain-containing protein n=1 Tax=Bacillus sp. 1P06AnD TaxID=3132208 RepID=UPI0039A1C2D0